MTCDNIDCVFEVEFTALEQTIDAEFEALDQTIDAEFAETLVINQSGEADPYEGQYEFTPTEETQVVQTAAKYLYENIRINPIPSNYGKITYDGGIITVS